MLLQTAGSGRPGNPMRAAGLSIIELMVAVAIGAFVLMGLITFASSSSQSQSEITKTARQIDNAQYAMQFLKEDLQNAGFFGQFFSNPEAPTAAPAACGLTEAELSAAIALPVQGFSNTNASTPCINNANYVAGTDVVIIRRASSLVSYEHTTEADESAVETSFDTNPSPLPFGWNASDGGLLRKGRMYIQSNIQETVIREARSSDDDRKGAGRFDLNELTQRKMTSGTPVPAPVRSLEVHIYFIAPCSNRGDCAVLGANNIPTLKRLVLDHQCFAGEAAFDDAGVAVTCPETETPIWTVEPIAEGVENLQIDYGLDTDDDGIADSVTMTPANPGDMANIVSVSLFAVLRNTIATLGEEDKPAATRKKFTLGLAGDTAVFNDGFRRNLYSGTVQLINVAHLRSTQ